MSRHPCGKPRLPAYTAEHIEQWAFTDLYAAAPASVRTALGLRKHQVGAVLALQASTHPDWLFNRILGLGIEEEATEQQLETVLGLYAPDACRAIQVGRLTHPANLGSWLRARGFSPRLTLANLWGETAAMPIGNPAMRTQAVDSSRSKIFAAVACDTYEDPPAVGDWLIATVGRPGWRHYLAFEDSVPVAVGLLFIREQVGWVGWDATLPAYRGRGAQRALLAQRIADAQRLGCRFLTADAPADSASYRNLLQSGFRCTKVRDVFLHDRTAPLNLLDHSDPRSPHPALVGEPWPAQAPNH